MGATTLRYLPCTYESSVEIYGVPFPVIYRSIIDISKGDTGKVEMELVYSKHGEQGILGHIQR